MQNLTLNILYLSYKSFIVSDLFQTLLMKSRPHYRSFKVYIICAKYTVTLCAFSDLFKTLRNETTTIMLQYRNFRIVHFMYIHF